MVKRLQAVGNSSGLIIDKPILKLLRITSETDLDVSTDGQRLIITPLRSDDSRKRKSPKLRPARSPRTSGHFASSPSDLIRLGAELPFSGRGPRLHDDQLRIFGGSAGVRDAKALESAVATPASTFDGTFLHEDIFHMAAAYCFHIAENQPFVDGNKRTGLNAALVFLDINGWMFRTPI